MALNSYSIKISLAHKALLSILSIIQPYYLYGVDYEFAIKISDLKMFTSIFIKS